MTQKQNLTQEQKLVVLESAREIGIRDAAKHIGVHYTTVYGWRKRLEALGEEGFLADRARSPGRGIKKISIEKETAVLETWERHSGFGPSQVRNQLRRQGITISTRSVVRIMEANGYRGIRRKREKGAAVLRFEASRPLELAQIDILEFYIHKQKVYLFILLDDFSRFITGWRLVTKTSIDEVIAVVKPSISRFGKMEELLSDRGFVFYSWHGVNRFERFLEVEGIHQIHARPHHPQTLGKVEAVNKQIQKELLRRERFNSVGKAQTAIEQWVKFYNYQRTHQGLGGCLVPADRFHGREEEVLRAIAEKIDPDGGNCYGIKGIPRSLFNVVLEDGGRIVIYLLGQAITYLGGSDERDLEHGRSGDADQKQADSESQRA